MNLPIIISLVIRGLTLGFISIGFGAEAGFPVRRTADEVLIVFNADSPVSRSVAKDYAQKRAGRHLLAIHCPDSAVRTEAETIAMALYQSSIEKPIRAYLAAHPDINFIVLTKGVPIRIHGSETGVRPDNSTPATPLDTGLDSHLASLDYQDLPGATRLSITGSGATGNGWINRYYNANEPFSHAKFGGYLVTRLDGYSEADAKALVTRALLAEQRGVSGEILLDVQPAFGLGDKAAQPARLTGRPILDESPDSDYNADLQKAFDLLQARGIPAELDLNPEFVGHRLHLAGYFSFGSNDSKYSSEAYLSLRFSPGSISDTAVSTSGRTFLPTSGGQSLLEDLIAHGLTCGKGYTDEPLLQAISSPSIVLERYTSGYTMAESFYSGSHFVGWQDVVVGDPLCAPFAHMGLHPLP